MEVREKKKQTAHPLVLSFPFLLQLNLPSNGSVAIPPRKWRGGTENSQNKKLPLLWQSADPHVSMTNMEMTDSSHKHGHDLLQSVKTHVKSLFLQLVGCICLCVIGCAGPLPFSAVVGWGFFS